MSDALVIIAASPASPLAPNTAPRRPKQSLVSSRIDHFQNGCAQKSCTSHAAPRPATRGTAPPPRGTREEDVPRQPKQRWHLIDAAQGVSVGRLAAAIAPVFRGKHKPGFEPHRHEHGDNVVVVNADRLVFTGRKWKQKLYRHHTGYMGGLKERTAADLQRRKPGEVLRGAVLGMLPKNKLRTIFIRRLWIYPGPEHPHTNVAP